MPDRSPDSRLAVVCHSCGYPSSAYVAGKITGEDDVGLFELSLIRCEYCDVASVVRQDEAGEFFPVEVWPRGPRKLDERIPPGIRRSRALIEEAADQEEPEVRSWKDHLIGCLLGLPSKCYRACGELEGCPSQPHGAAVARN